MRVPILAKFAARTLGRNVRRTLLSVVGVGIGCGIAVFMVAFMRGSSQIRIRSIAESGFGHARIAHNDWARTRDNDLRLVDWEGELAAARQARNVAVAAPHARTTALLAFGTRVQGVEMTGVDPVAETKINRLVRAIGSGRYLEPGESGVTVVGSTIAERLEVEVGDPLFLTAVGASGDMEYAMLSIVGIIDTGSRDMDATICHVTLEEVERISGRVGAGEISILLENPLLLERTVSELSSVVPEGDEVVTWKEVVPQQAADYESDWAFMNMLSGIVVVVAVLGIAGAQLTAILERRREFAVLIALGMKGRQVIGLIFLEAVTMGVLGAVAGLALSFPLVYRTATAGWDITKLMGDFTISGVLFEPVFYSEMGLWMIPLALVVSMVSMLFAAVYPAWYALRIDPTSALSLREA
jgi:ABC-type lipoprotein release transport system permease subunit